MSTIIMTKALTMVAPRAYRVCIQAMEEKVELLQVERYSRCRYFPRYLKHAQSIGTHDIAITVYFRNYPSHI